MMGVNHLELACLLHLLRAMLEPKMGPKREWVIWHGLIPDP